MEHTKTHQRPFPGTAEIQPRQWPSLRDCEVTNVGSAVVAMWRRQVSRDRCQTVAEEIERLRRQRWTGKQIAAATGVSPATVSRVLRRLGLNKLSALEPAEPVRRYEREHPGELIHLDIKKLGRIGSVGHRITGRYPGAVNRHHGIGWEFVHVCIDDASRIAFVQVLVDQRKKTAVAFLEAAVAYFAKLGVRIERVMTDNGSCYRLRPRHVPRSKHNDDS